MKNVKIFIKQNCKLYKIQNTNYKIQIQNTKYKMGFTTTHILDILNFFKRFVRAALATLTKLKNNITEDQKGLIIVIIFIGWISISNYIEKENQIASSSE